MFVNENDALKFTAAEAIPANHVMLYPGTTIPGQTANLRPAAIGEEVALQVRGVLKLSSASATTFAANAFVNWDSSTKLVVESGGNFVLGRALKAKTNGQTVATVMIDPGQAAGAQFTTTTTTTTTAG